MLNGCSLGWPSCCACLCWPGGRLRGRGWWRLRLAWKTPCTLCLLSGMVGDRWWKCATHWFLRSFWPAWAGRFTEGVAGKLQIAIFHFIILFYFISIIIIIIFIGGGGTLSEED